MTKLAGYTIADPARCSYDVVMTGRQDMMADGNPRQFTSAASRVCKLWTVEWNYLSTSELNTLVTAYQALVNSGSGTWEPPGGGSYTVTAVSDLSSATSSDGVFRYRVTLRLREVI